MVISLKTTSCFRIKIHTPLGLSKQNLINFYMRLKIFYRMQECGISTHRNHTINLCESLCDIKSLIL